MMEAIVLVKLPKQVMFFWGTIRNSRWTGRDQLAAQAELSLATFRMMLDLARGGVGVGSVVLFVLSKQVKATSSSLPNLFLYRIWMS